MVFYRARGNVPPEGFSALWRLHGKMKLAIFITNVHIYPYYPINFIFTAMSKDSIINAVGLDKDLPNASKPSPVIKPLLHKD